MLWSWEKSLAPAGYRTPAIQPIARRYTDWAMSVQYVLQRKVTFWDITEQRQRRPECAMKGINEQQQSALTTIHRVTYRSKGNRNYELQTANTAWENARQETSRRKRDNMKDGLRPCTLQEISCTAMNQNSSNDVAGFCPQTASSNACCWELQLLQWPGVFLGSGGTKFRTPDDDPSKWADYFFISHRPFKGNPGTLR
jgi:hypothetical protein